MKKNSLLLLLLFALTFVTSSCNNDDDPAPPAVVGKWNLDRVQMTNWTGSFGQQVNNSALEPSLLLNLEALEYGYIEIDVRASNNRFYRNARNGAFVDVSEGTWTLTNNELVLKDDNADEERYTYDPVRGTLTGPTINRAINVQFEDGSTLQSSGQVSLIFEKMD
jgi:uncharacterized lipoprotein NlpE involved in copper resistance